tara:strand:- start:760 stop:2073 length:1314 start_codon:yes stop_codon:yes gene_type:complete
MIRFFLLFFLSTSLLAQETDSLWTVEEVVGLALEQNYDIRLERNNLSIAENNNTLGNAGFLPTVELNGVAGKTVQDTELLFANGDGQSRTGAVTTSYNASAGLTWTLFDGLKMFATKDRLEEIQRSNQFAFKSQLQTTISDVMKAYYNTALEQERLALLESTLRLSEERVKISQDKYELGKASKLEYLQAKVDYNTDQSAYVKQKEIISVRKFQLIEFLALQDQDMNFKLDYQYELEEPPSEEIVIDAALHNNPDLNYLNSNREVALLSKVELERQQWPSLDFNLGYSYSNLNAEAGFLQSNQSNGINYGLTATMTLFDGLNQKRSIQNARIQAESSQLSYEQARSQLVTAVRSAYLTYKNSVELAELEYLNLEVAQENEEIAFERYRIGKSNPLELREAQNNRLNAEVRYLEARNTAKIAEIELQRLSGLLLDQTP